MDHRLRHGGGASGMNPVSDWAGEQIDNPLYVGEHSFYKVEKWTRDGSKVDSLLYAGNDLDKARGIFAQTRSAAVSTDLTGSVAMLSALCASLSQEDISARFPLAA
jgi:hypothetical protein